MSINSAATSTRRRRARPERRPAHIQKAGEAYILDATVYSVLYLKIFFEAVCHAVASAILTPGKVPAGFD
jgi:hypothetical protein